jgi:c-di-AMP phosphodiesterase-like protein
VNVQFILEKLGGGGHFTSAATLLGDVPVEKAATRLLSTLSQYLDSARNALKEGD